MYVSTFLLLQETALTYAASSHLDSHFWIKADACDVNPGVQESMNHEWAGDVDLNDGQAEYEVYVSLVSRLKQPCLF